MFSIELDIQRLDIQKLEGPVNAFIKHKLYVLGSREEYSPFILGEIENEVRYRA
jgi:hypothetical protein